MALLGLILLAFAKIINMLTGIYTWIVFGAALASWMQADPYNPIARFLDQATRPVYSALRPYLPKFVYSSALDFTPLVVLMIVIIIQIVLVGSLNDWGQKLR